MMLLPDIRYDIGDIVYLKIGDGNAMQVFGYIVTSCGLEYRCRLSDGSYQDFNDFELTSDVNERILQI